MQVRVKLHGLLVAGADSPDGWLEVTVPEGTDVAGVFEALGEISPLFDPRACLAIVDEVKAPLDWTLKDGDRVHLYHLFSGG